MAGPFSAIMKQCRQTEVPYNVRLLIAFDKFKDNMSAQTACRVAADTLRAKRPDISLELTPLADGGEGFAEILTSAVSGELKSTEVTGPLGEPVMANWGLVAAEQLAEGMAEWLQLPESGTYAVIEMAQAAGLEQVPLARRNPWATSTRGVGQLLREAADHHVEGIILGIGGSATNDGGVGALAELGLELCDSAKKALRDVSPGNWKNIVSIQKSMTPLPPLRIACDVSNPLLGSRGATAVYGPQKGLPASEHASMERALEAVARQLVGVFDKAPSVMSVPSSGAAGGIGFGLSLAYDAQYRPGFELVTHWLGLESKVAAADVVITGEGRFDASSLDGKGPGALIELARHHGKPVHVFAGHVTDDAREQSKRGAAPIALHAIEPPGMLLAEALKRGPENLSQSIATSLEQLIP